MGTIVVGVDESPNAANALLWAVDEAHRRGWTVCAVLCWGFLDQHPRSRIGFDPGYHATDAQQAIDTSVAAAVGEDEAAWIERKIVNDLPARGLLEASAGADLLVLGARGLGSFKEITLGSVSRQCVHHSAIPVAIIKDHSPPDTTFGRVVTGVDGSDESRHALAWAAEAARVRRATVVAVYAWSPPFAGADYVIPGPTDPQMYRDAASEVLDHAVEAVIPEDTDTNVERVLLRGDARSALVEEARSADLLVVGSRGRGGFKGLLLGSVSHHVIHHATCPVVVIPRQH